MTARNPDGGATLLSLAAGSLLTVALILGACGSGNHARSSATGPLEKQGGVDPYLSLVLQDPHGRAIRLAEFEGKVRIIDVWASWCTPCRAAIPHLNDIQERYGDRGLVVVGISVDSDPEDVLEFQRDVPIRYPTGMFNPEVEAVLGNPEAVPTTYLIDRAGTVRETFQGVVDAETLEGEIREIL